MWKLVMVRQLVSKITIVSIHSVMKQKCKGSSTYTFSVCAVMMLCFFSVCEQEFKIEIHIYLQLLPSKALECTFTLTHIVIDNA